AGRRSRTANGTWACGPRRKGRTPTGWRRELAAGTAPRVARLEHKSRHSVQPLRIGPPNRGGTATIAAFAHSLLTCPRAPGGRGPLRCCIATNGLWPLPLLDAGHLDRA